MEGFDFSQKNYSSLNLVPNNEDNFYENTTNVTNSS